MKSYTSIEQSKKLAEFLPLESADMNWHELPSIGLFVRAFPYKQDNGATEGLYPCWGLVALLSVLDFPSLIQNKEDEWEVCVPNHKSDGYIEVLADNPVDTCYKMIIKLHE